MSSRFALLLHRTPKDHSESNHWDLLLEPDEAEGRQGLITWSMPPMVNADSVCLDSFECLAKQKPDHRRIYLDYEGPINGNRGSVQRLDFGRLRVLGVEQFRLQGNLLNGIVLIQRLAPQSATLTYLKASETQYADVRTFRH